VCQATICTNDDTELAGALYAVVTQLRSPLREGLDKAALAVLHQAHQVGTVRPSDLATTLHLDLSTISRHLQALEQQGFVQRTADPDDARAQRISVTTNGADLLTRLLQHRAAAIRDAVAHWPAADRHTLRRLLCLLADDLAQVGQRSAPAPARPSTDVRAPTELMMEKT
jgi:DNA-binding MarR family transcriptional regulator